MSLVEIKNIKKEYGIKKVIDGVSLEIESGKIIGLLGPNGGGKTTLLRVLAGLVKSYTGDVKIDGNKIGVKTRKVVSYLPDETSLDKNWSVENAIKFYGDMFPDFNKEKMQDLMGFLKIENSKLIREMSKGAREKLYLALTLSREAKLFLLDEPLNGVDMVTREKILSAIVRYFDEDSTVIITTHLVGEIERLFDDVIFMDKGKIVLKDNAEDLRFREKQSISKKFSEMFADA